MRLDFVDDFVPALVVGDEVVDIRAAVAGLDGSSPQRLMSEIIARFDVKAPSAVIGQPTRNASTADEIGDHGRLRVRLWVNDELRQDYATSDAEHPVARLVAFASSVMTLRPGDMIACGTNHQGLGALQDGDRVTMEIDGLGRLEVDVREPLKRTWARGSDRAMAERVRARRLPATS